MCALFKEKYMKKIVVLLGILMLIGSCAYAETIKIYQKESSGSIYDDSRGMTIERQSSESLEISPILNGQFDGKKNKIRNKSGRNQDYIIAPDNSTAEVKAAIENLERRVNDPYVINVNGVKYYMIKNSADGQYTLDNIVGYGDNKKSLFASLIALNSDNDKSKLTKAELDKAGIRFVAVNPQGKLLVNDTSKDLKDIISIDLSTLKESVNNGKIGSFGYFDVYVNQYGEPKKKVGYVSFDSDEELLEMLK